MTLRPAIMIVRVITTLACAAQLTGCGGSGGDDDPNGGSSGAPVVREQESPVVREEDLDLGGIEPRAGDVPETAGDLANGRAVEARRLAEVVIDPSTLDDRFQAVGLPTGALTSPTQIANAFASYDPNLFKDRISGAAARRFMGSASDNDIDMSIYVVSFKDPATAARAVKSISEKDETNSINVFGSVTFGSRTTLAGHPEVNASLLRTSREDPAPSLAGHAAYGDLMVSMVIPGRPGKLALAEQLMSRAFTEQRAALKGFESTPLSEIVELRVDEDGLSMLALSAREGNSKDQEPDVPSIWGPNGALHQQTWAGNLREAFERAELEAMVQAGSNVYRTGSTEQAKRLLDDFEETVTQVNYREGNKPRGLSDARCYELVATSSIGAPHFCQVQYGRYVAEGAGKSAADAQARISAQYLLLQEELG